MSGDVTAAIERLRAVTPWGLMGHLTTIEAEVERLRAAFTSADRGWSEALEDRDHWYERLDKLIYSLATIEEIGEWSSGNDPADQFVEHIGAKVQRLESENERLRAEREALHSDEMRERLWEAIAQVRDASPRLPNDADTHDVIDAVLSVLSAGSEASR